jgi:hypothetical protein
MFCPSVDGFEWRFHCIEKHMRGNDISLVSLRDHRDLFSSFQPPVLRFNGMDSDRSGVEVGASREVCWNGPDGISAPNRGSLLPIVWNCDSYQSFTRESRFITGDAIAQEADWVVFAIHV